MAEEVKTVEAEVKPDKTAGSEDKTGNAPEAEVKAVAVKETGAELAFWNLESDPARKSSPSF